MHTFAMSKDNIPFEALCLCTNSFAPTAENRSA